MINLEDFMLFQEENHFSHNHTFEKMQESKWDMTLIDGLKQIQPTRLRLPSFFQQVGMISDNNYYSTQGNNSSERIEFFNCHEEESVEKQERKCKKSQKQHIKSKNQTKNIPKNFGKGIISFIEKNQTKLRPIIHNEGLHYDNLLDFLMIQKKYINTIADLRKLWTHETYGKILRIISNLFFRKYSLNYIFNSRISSYNSHIKNRNSLWSALKNPQNFKRIKLF